MSDFDDDTPSWEDPTWNATGDVPATPIPRQPRQPRPRPAPRGRRTGGGIERTRTHHVVTSRPVADAYDDLEGDWSPVDHWVEPESHAPRRVPGVDPRLMRLGAVVVAAVLMIPVAMTMRSKPSDSLKATAATTTAPSATVAAPALNATPSTVDAASAAPASETATATPSPAVEAARSRAAVVTSKPKKLACAGYYTVIANDYWNRFPKSSGASAKEWLAANNATADTPLYVGHKLCIPPGAKAPAPPPTTTPTTKAPATTAAPARVDAASGVAAPAPATTAAPPRTTAAPAPPPPTAPPTTKAPAPVAAPVVTIAPPPTPGAVVPPPALDPASVEAIIREIWPADLQNRALAIAQRESHLNPSVHNYCCYGVFAIYFDMGKSWLAQMGVTSPQQLLDARTNVLAAYKLYTLAGWTPWA